MLNDENDENHFRIFFNREVVGLGEEKCVSHKVKRFIASCEMKRNRCMTITRERFNVGQMATATLLCCVEFFHLSFESM